MQLFSSVSNQVSIGSESRWCSVGPDLATNYLQSILSDSQGPVVNILTIFSNANILKKKNIKGNGCPLLISINIDQVTEK